VRQGLKLLQPVHTLLQSATVSDAHSCWRPLWDTGKQVGLWQALLDLGLAFEDCGGGSDSHGGVIREKNVRVSEWALGKVRLELDAERAKTKAT
jgi:hypothetical protein